MLLYFALFAAFGATSPFLPPFLHGAQTDKLCQLATKLKLAPSSRYRSDHTERTTRVNSAEEHYEEAAWRNAYSVAR